MKNIEELNNYLENLEERHEKVIKNLGVNGKKKILYHYTSIYGLEGILKNAEFWVSHSDFLNDKTELHYTYKLCEEILREIINGDEETLRETLDFFDDAYHKYDQTGMFLLSLTTNKDSNLLWSNYSNNDGYNIAFKYPNLVRSIKDSVDQKNLFVFPGNVIYEKTTQKKFLKEELQIMIELLRFRVRESSKELSDKVLDKIFDIVTAIKFYSMFFKDCCFEQEEEFRIAFVKRGNSLKQDGFRISNGAFIPYIKAPFIKQEEVIESITIGPKNKMDIAKEGLSKFVEHYEYSNLKKENIKQSRIPYRY